MSIPYARPYWNQEEREELLRVLESGWWTNGPAVARFEAALRDTTGAEEVVCVANGTAALHMLLHLLRPANGPALMVTSALNFAASASAALLCGYDIAFTDIDPDTLNMSPASLREVLKDHASDYARVIIIPVHYAGLSVDMNAIASVARDFGADLIEDACHALGGTYDGSQPCGQARAIGGRSDSSAAVFSFHPAKTISSAEGGAIALADPALARKLRLLRNHNMDREHVQFADNAFDRDGERNPWYYEIHEPGLNYRMSDIHAAIGIAQLARLPESLARRHELAGRYRSAIADLPHVRMVPDRYRACSGLHLFPVEIDIDGLGMSKRQVFKYFASRGVSLQVHYVMLHQQPAFAHQPLVRQRTFPNADRAARGLASLPLFYGLTDQEQDIVITVVRDLALRFSNASTNVDGAQRVESRAL